METNFYYQGQVCEVLKMMDFCGDTVVKIRRICWNGNLTEHWTSLSNIEVR